MICNTLHFFVINGVKRALIDEADSAGTNEMCYREFNKSKLDLPRVNTEKLRSSSPLACEGDIRHVVLFIKENVVARVEFKVFPTLS
jgi:hypothetical protein